MKRTDKIEPGDALSCALLESFGGRPTGERVDVEVVAVDRLWKSSAIRTVKVRVVGKERTALVDPKWLEPRGG